MFASLGNLTLYHTICADNFGNNVGAGLSASITSNGYNLIGDVFPVPSYAVASDILNIEPQLLEPMRRGGITYTCAFRPSSPACDAGDPSISFPPVADQRGFARIKDGDGSLFGGAEIDIGAFELGETLVVDIEADENGAPGTGTGTSLREAVSEAVTLGAGTRIIFDPSVEIASISSSEVVINSALWIDGADRRVSIFGNSLTRVLRVSPGETASLDQVAIVGGKASTGAGIEVDSGAHLNLVDTSINDNEATGNGGGVRVTDASVFALRTLFISNESDAFGGAVYVRGKFVAKGCVFKFNGAVNGGGAISDNGDDEISLESCTVTANFAESRGGGLDVGVTDPEIALCVFGDNFLQPAGTPSNFYGNSGVVISRAINAEDGTGMFTGPTDLTGIDLATNGDIPIPFKSPLIDQGPDANSYDYCCGSRDIVGNPRLTRGSLHPVDGTARLDIGAFESVETYLVDTPVDQSDGPEVGGMSLRDAIALCQRISDKNAIEFDPSISGTPIQLEAVHGGELEILASVTIQGPGPFAEGIQIRGSGAAAAIPFRVLSVTAGEVLLRLLTFEDGNAGSMGNGGNLEVRTNGSFEMEDCIIRGGRAKDGGGLSVDLPRFGLSFGSTGIKRCSIYRNTAEGLGGGMYTRVSKPVEVSGSTISCNTAADGAGVYVTPNFGVFYFFRITITGNEATSANGVGGIYGGSAAQLDACIVASNPGGDTDSTVSISNSVVGIEAHLRSFGYYGGSTPTYALEPASPAIDLGGSLEPDQRGVRASDGNGDSTISSDAGAYEFGSAIVVDTLDDDFNGPVNGTSLREAIDAAVSGDRIVFDAGLSGGTIDLGSAIEKLGDEILQIDAGGLAGGLTLRNPSQGPFLYFFIHGDLDMRGLRTTGDLTIFGGRTLSVSDCYFDTISNINAISQSSGGVLRIERSTFENCSGATAVFGFGALTEISQCSFINNSSPSGAGAVSVFNQGRIRHCTFSGNSTSSPQPIGSAVEFVSGDGTLEIGFCSFDSSAPTSPVSESTTGTIVSIGHNLSLHPAPLLSHSTDLTSTDPKLAYIVRPVGDPPALISGYDSPLIDAAIAAPKDLPVTDQLGNPRVQDNNGDGNAVLDIGATESRPIALVDTEFDEDDGAGGGMGYSLREAVKTVSQWAGNVRPRIRFAPHLDNSVIQLQQAFGGELLLDRDHEIDASTLPAGLTVAGSRSTGGGSFRVFQANASGEIVSLRCLTIERGQANDFGGGLLVENGTDCVLTDCTVRDSFAPALGGGIAVRGGSFLELERSTVSGNESAGFGGGLGFDGSLAQISNSTISGNHADSGGGGIADLNNQAGIDLQHVTIAANTATNGGAGIDFAFQSGIARHVILAQNTPINFNPRTASGNIASNGYNLDDGTNGQFSSGSDLAGVPDAKLGPLQDNGGRTETHALLYGSPAIDNGDPAFAGTGFFAFDQTGFRLRVNDGDYLNPSTIDIGAFELDLSTLPIDMDGDCVPNADEVAMGWDPTDPSDGLADTDGDGQRDGKEWIAGTDLNDADSLLELLSVLNISNDSTLFQLEWASVVHPSITYDIYASTDVKNWTRIATGISASGATTLAFPSVSPPDQKRLFFEVRAVRP